MKRIIVQKLLSAILQKNSVGSLKNLREVLDDKFSGNNLAKKLVAQAHVACFSSDAREISFAIKTFAKLEEWDELFNLLRICKIYKVFKPVLEIMQIGIENNIPKLQFPDFDEWFVGAVKWFDLYHDSKKGLFFIAEEDCDLINQITINQPDFWKHVFSDSDFFGTRRKLLEKLSLGENPIVAVKDNREDVEEQFLEYCDLNKLIIVRRLQEGIIREGKCSYVYLVIDSDGIFKIYKEILDYNDRISFEHEGKIYRNLPEIDFLPKCYGGPEGFVEIKDYKFLKLSVHFGQSLADYTNSDNLLSKKEALYVICELARKLKFLLDEGVLYLDLKPENILLDRSEVKLLDLGIVKILKSHQKVTDIFLADARYGTPENCLNYQASESSLVYQLGIIFVQLLTGKHPFEVVSGLDENNRESAILKHSWVSAVAEPNLEDVDFDIVSEMLAKDSCQRPSLEKVVNLLEIKQKINIVQKGRKSRVRENNTILFVGRMGIPHKGHIEYISRFLEMGFFVRIAISKSYTINQNDPLPKWIVMKMIAQSLFSRGFGPDDFEFMLTPFYENDYQTKMHFLMMPYKDDVVGVGSGNPSVWRLFEDKPIFDQKSVFGIEGQEYFNLSWGEILRQAVIDGDYKTFSSYTAIGVEKILSFAEIKSMYGQPEIEFVPGKVSVRLLDSNEEILRGQVLRYGTLEESLVFHLKKKGYEIDIIDIYSCETEIILNGVRGKIIYEGVEFDGKDEMISLRFYKN